MTNSISREQLQSKLNEQTPITIVEVLPAKYFEAEHIPGAINIPHDEIRERADDELTDKEAVIVVYCSNTACQNSKIAANTLEQMGYRNIFEYIEGKQHWLQGNLPVERSK